MVTSNELKGWATGREGWGNSDDRYCEWIDRPSTGQSSDILPHLPSVDDRPDTLAPVGKRNVWRPSERIRNRKDVKQTVSPIAHPAPYIYVLLGELADDMNAENLHNEMADVHARHATVTGFSDFLYLSPNIRPSEVKALRGELPNPNKRSGRSAPV